jgi:hypothetical protein
MLRLVPSSSVFTTAASVVLPLALFACGGSDFEFAAQTDAAASPEALAPDAASDANGASAADASASDANGASSADASASDAATIEAAGSEASMLDAPGSDASQSADATHSADLDAGGDLDAGQDRPHGLLPVDERNPVIITNDTVFDNWQGEYALLLANSGGPAVAGIAISDSPNWSDVDANLTGWKGLVEAARASGLRNVPDPIASHGARLRRPDGGDIDATVPNRSEGAQLIVELSRRVALPSRPVVVATGGRLTDVADAYLLDHTLPDRVIVVASLGTVTASGDATMDRPNGEMDPWADIIVAQKFRYVQVSAHYHQLDDVPAARVSELPANAFGSWMAAKQPKIPANDLAADQVGVVAMSVHDFAVTVTPVSARTADASTNGPALAADAEGHDWLVSASDGAAASRRLWQMLGDSAIFAR